MSDLRVTNLRGRTSGKSPKMPNGAVVTGVATATSFSGNLTGNVTGNATGLSGTPNLNVGIITANSCLLYTSPSPRDAHESRMPSSA